MSLHVQKHQFQSLEKAVPDNKENRMAKNGSLERRKKRKNQKSQMETFWNYLEFELADLCDFVF